MLKVLVQRQVRSGSGVGHGCVGLYGASAERAQGGLERCCVRREGRGSCWTMPCRAVPCRAVPSRPSVCPFARAHRHVFMRVHAHVLLHTVMRLVADRDGDGLSVSLQHLLPNRRSAGHLCPRIATR